MNINSHFSHPVSTLYLFSISSRDSTSSMSDLSGIGFFIGNPVADCYSCSSVDFGTVGVDVDTK